MEGGGGTWTSFVYGIAIAVITAVGAQISVYITAAKKKASDEKAIESNVALARINRDGLNHDQLVQMLSGRLTATEVDRDRYRGQVEDTEQKNLELRRELARVRFYAGVLRGMLVTNNLVVPDITVYDIREDDHHGT